MSPLRLTRVAVLPLTAALAACADPTATVFDRATLHTVEITVESRYLADLESDLDTRVPCTLRYDGEAARSAEIRQKGNTAVDLSDKPSFSIWLDDELHGIDKLILDNAGQDSTFLRELVGADALVAAGLPAARVAHATVRFNGSDGGIYVVSEAIDQGFLRRQFGEKNDDGNLYEGPCCGDFVDVGHMTLDDEKKDDRNRNDLYAFADVVTTTPDDELAVALAERLDLDVFLTHYAVEAVLGHWDGYAFRGNNYYMYDNPADGRFVFIAHGMDRILQDAWFDPETSPAGTLPPRIRALASLDDRLHAELSRVVSAWDEATALESIDQAADVIRSAASGERTLADVSTFEANVGALRQLVSQRRALLDPTIQCGDGKIEGLETCDDGNAESGDGCSARCRIEP